MVMAPLDDVIAKAAAIFGGEEAACVWMRSPVLALEGRRRNPFWRRWKGLGS